MGWTAKADEEVAVGLKKAGKMCQLWRKKVFGDLSQYVVVICHYVCISIILYIDPAYTCNNHMTDSLRSLLVFLHCCCQRVDTGSPCSCSVSTSRYLSIPMAKRFQVDMPNIKSTPNTCISIITSQPSDVYTYMIL